MNKKLAMLITFAVSTQSMCAAQKQARKANSTGILTPEEYQNRGEKAPLTKEEELQQAYRDSIPKRDEQEMAVFTQAMNKFFEQARLIGTGNFLYLLEKQTYHE